MIERNELKGDNLKIAICDDRAGIEEVRRHLKHYFAEKEMLYSLSVFQSSADILCSDKNFDIAFLDIEIDQTDGLSVGRALQQVNKNTVLIYVAADTCRLDEAMDLGIIRFFDKPIESERFCRGMDKALEKVREAQTRFFLKDAQQGIAPVCSYEIIFVEILGRKTKVVTKRQTYFSKENIKTWRERLNQSCFASPHSSFIVNMDYITYYNKSYLVLNGRYNVPIAYTKRTDFRHKMMQRIGRLA